MRDAASAKPCVHMANKLTGSLIVILDLSQKLCVYCADVDVEVAICELCNVSVVLAASVAVELSSCRRKVVGRREWGAFV